MPGPPKKLPTFRKGQTLTAADLNMIVQAIIKRVQGSPGLDVRAFNGQLIFSLTGQLPKLAIGRQMQIQSDEGDFLICRELDANGNIGTADINVLKPWILRRTPFDNLTVNGTAYVYSDNGTRLADGTETQKITQDYFVGAEITVRDLNIAFQVTPGVFTSLIDSNDSGREWCEPE